MGLMGVEGVGDDAAFEEGGMDVGRSLRRRLLLLREGWPW